MLIKEGESRAFGLAIRIQQSSIRNFLNDRLPCLRDLR